jgi:hypothetical protein
MNRTVIGRSSAILTTMMAFSAVAGAQQAASKVPVRKAVIAGVQGFNIVLVLGDLEGVPSDGNGNVPTAARKALADMKDFLPYKSYRLLDTAWILSASESTTATSRLRGPDDRDYELTLGAASEPANAPGNRTLRMTFQLRDPSGREVSATPSLDHIRASLLDAERRAGVVPRGRDPETKKDGDRTPPSTDDARIRNELEARILELQGLQNRARMLAPQHPELQSLQTRERAFATQHQVSIIDTGFTMDVGETVVVGTSRVRGEKAIIALLTAVPRSVKK